MSKKTKSGNANTPPASDGNVTDKSPYVFQREKIGFDLNIKELPWTSRQKQIIDLFLNKDTRVMFLKGPAGASKTILAMYCGLQLLNSRRVSDMVLIRSAVESSDSKLGFLPGDMLDKFGVYLAPFNEKFAELLNTSQIKKLENDNRIIICPINFARGLHFSVKFVCCDEAQNLTIKELQTLLTRLGEFCKVIICGDPDQSDLPKDKSGFKRVYELFDTPEAKELGIHCIELEEQDIMRSEICKYIVNKFKHLINTYTDKHNETIKKNAHIENNPCILDSSQPEVWNPSRNSTT
jgi:phosphate starvation-inducible protein PhoH